MISSRSLASVAAITGASLFVLTACSPAKAPYEPPPPAPEASGDIAAGLDGTEAEAFSTAQVSDEDADLHEDEDGDHDEHDHDEEGFVGEAHVHGAGDLTVTQEDGFLTVTLDAPLASFGLPEDVAPEGETAEQYATGIAEPLGPTECEVTERSAEARSHGGHGAMTVSVVWRCAKIDRIEGMRFTLFDTYPAFHHVDAVYLGPDGEQVARELSPTDTELDFD